MWLGDIKHKLPEVHGQGIGGLSFLPEQSVRLQKEILCLALRPRECTATHARLNGIARRNIQMRGYAGAVQHDCIRHDDYRSDDFYGPMVAA